MIIMNKRSVLMIQLSTYSLYRVYGELLRRRSNLKPYIKTIEMNVSNLGLL